MNNADKKRVIHMLAEEYADARPMLMFSTPFELLVAVILSAQCTDERVNIVTSRLFPEYGTPGRLLQLSRSELENMIRDAGLYRAKAGNLLATAAIILSEHNSEVPDNYDDLIKLPGVGRKTANVVLSVAYDIPALAVDTHVFRVANRTGLARGTTPEEVEAMLQLVIARELWAKAHHWLIWHGRKVCKARAPFCKTCLVEQYCDKNGIKL